MKISASAKTFFKYLFWTGVAAAIQGALTSYTTLDLPAWSIPLIGAALKSAATYAATQTEEV